MLKKEQKMAEKILHEIRVIETDEGYRIEVNGDKEHLREMGFRPKMFGFGPGMGRRGRHGHPRGGPWGRHSRRQRRGCDSAETDSDQTATKEKSPDA